MATLRGGDKFEAAMAELARKIAKPATLRVGFLEGATYPDGKPVAMIAAINEYGRPPMQPPRPFFRRMIAEKQGEWPEAIAELLRANDMNVKKALNLTGAAIEGQLKQSIVDFSDPPNAPATIKRKGHSKPLVGGPAPGGGHMLKSTGFEVKT